jgi:hypothetical protein
MTPITPYDPNEPPGNFYGVKNLFELYMLDRYKDPNWKSNLNPALIQKEYRKYYEEFQRVLEENLKRKRKPNEHVLSPLAEEAPPRLPQRSKHRKK